MKRETSSLTFIKIKKELQQSRRESSSRNFFIACFKLLTEIGIELAKFIAHINKTEKEKLIKIGNSDFIL